VAATSDADNASPANNMLAGFNNGYRAAANLVALDPSTISNYGGSQPHENQQPYLALTYCIALQGIFPSRN
jgi:microcystin-dependent protein